MSSAYVSSDRPVLSPPGIVGHARLVTPATVQNGRAYQLALHFDPEAVRKLEVLIGEFSARLIDDLRERAGTQDIALPNFREWIQGKMRASKRGSISPHPILFFGANISSVTRMRGWSADNQKLDLKRLRLGRGSIAEAVIRPGLSWNGEGVAFPTLMLRGVRVLKLKQVPSRALKAPPFDPAEYGGKIEPDDLSQFAVG